MTAPPAFPESIRRRSLIFLGLAVAGAGFAMAMQAGLNVNFLVQEIHILPQEQGYLEAARETCGISALLVLALLAGLAEPLVGAAMLLLLAAGLSAYGVVHEYAWIVGMSMVWSLGLHVWMPLPNSMTLALAEPGRAGARLGQIAAAASVGTGIGLATALGLTYADVPIRPLYFVGGAAAVLAAAACLGIYRRIKTPGPRLVFRRKYGLYYLLSLLEGARKQIFICFASYLLVKNYETPLTVMLILMIINQVFGYLLSPWVGRLIDRIGERRILLFYYVTIIIVFLGYAWIPTSDFAGFAWIPKVYFLYALYIVDSVLFSCALALTTIVNRLAPKSEHTQTLSMGVAMNHVAAVITPAVGGIIWARYDFRWTFMVGAAVAVLSIIVSRYVPRHTVPAAVA